MQRTLPTPGTINEDFVSFSKAVPVSVAPRLTSNLFCVASMLAWACGFPTVEFLLVPIPALPLAALRLALGTLFLLPVWACLEGPGALMAANWRKGLVIGAIGFGAGAFLLIVAQEMTDAVTVTVITASSPVVGIALECLLDGRRLTVRLVAGLVLSILGALIAVSARLGMLTLGPGALVAFASVLFFTWGSRATVRGLPEQSAIGRTTVTLLGAALAATTASIVTQAFGGPTVNWAGIGPSQLAALALYSIVALSLSQVFWIMGVGRLGIGLASLHFNAAPFYVMILLFLLGGSWNWLQVVGALIVTIGVMVAQGFIGSRIRPATA